MYNIHLSFRAHGAALCALISVLDEKNDPDVTECAESAVCATLGDDSV